jgi:hypothetical protein
MITKDVAINVKVVAIRVMKVDFIKIL